MDNIIVRRILIILLVGLGILFLIYSSHNKPKEKEDFLDKSVRIQGIILIIAIIVAAIILLL